MFIGFPGFYSHLQFRSRFRYGGDVVVVDRLHFADDVQTDAPAPGHELDSRRPRALPVSHPFR